MSTPEINKAGPQQQHVYAVIRIDAFLGPEVALDRKVTVKKIVWSEEEARAEVERLNRLQADRSCYYFAQMTRLENEPLARERIGPSKENAAVDLSR